MTSHIGTRTPGKDLHVRTRRTVQEGGRIAASKSVHCPRRDGSVSVAECLLCADCEGIRTAADGSYLACSHPLATEPPLDEHLRARRVRSGADRIPLSAIMTGDVICVRSDLSIETLAALFVDRCITGAPVVDESGRPIGVVSKSDLVQAGLELNDLGEVDESVEELPQGFHLEPSSRGTVADIMMPMAFVLPENATLSHAAALMAYEGVHRVPVVATNGKVAGIISSMDVVRWLAENDGYALPRSDRGASAEDREENP